MSAIDNCLLAKNPSLSPAAALYTAHDIITANNSKTRVTTHAVIVNK